MTFVNPYHGSSGPWLRGNLHTHTTNSDGKLSPVETVALYAEHGYDLLALSDHDRLTLPVEHPSVVGITAVEVSAGGPHLLAVGVDKVYDTSRPRGCIVDEIMADGGLCVLCHPNWLEHFNHWDQVALESVGPYHGIEIFNSVIDFLPGEAHALDRWDMLLAKGRRVWGFADDDFHAPGHGPRGWNMVRANARTPDAIVEALQAGRFYASTGVTIEAVELVGNVLTITAPDAEEIRFVGRWGAVVAFGGAGEASYEIRGSEGYVRAECYGRGRHAAWTQPVFVEEP
ncbi:MAG: CehA/McbA family metallohydrolase [Armatimonadetes bacterium]|nr:CehA/McbA family metallohydrolase [Armatimonadota bacterium]